MCLVQPTPYPSQEGIQVEDPPPTPSQEGMSKERIYHSHRTSSKAGQALPGGVFRNYNFSPIIEYNTFL